MTTPTPPPPNYAPTAGLSTTWWSQTTAAVWTPENLAAADRAQQRTVEAIDRVGLYITETPEERRSRQRQEDDARREAEGETPRERAQRHRAEDRKRQHLAQRLATLPWRHEHTERARRFRRWCTLTALSASAGFAVGLVQWAASLPLAVGIGTWAGAYVLDLKVRGWGRTPVSQVRGPGRVVVLVLARVPVASALAAVCHLSPLLAATGHLLHHH
ncbi:hypothetical protein F7Q99_39370 [Streptomyces kaniharaensis]|uniref:Uncharacterized protein n=1 Tax=Streptomyces kaniharaensis TaxID=212423 RepID=A0A6N7L383_9ACTN|nr:hypothetical protein [Streptomyces kaniharaensis]MQS18091.1 hypothetical protein [Streptomyces kaniharaensis]